MTEYEEAFNEMDEHSSYKMHQWFGRRQDLVGTYGWAIPSTEAIDYLSDSFDVMVEIGAGAGYWAYELENAGIIMFPVDVEPPERTWTAVVKGDEFHTTQLPLLLVWPPCGDEMAANALEVHQENSGTDVVYVGEWRGCTADERFHNMLEEEYELVHSIDIPSYQGIRDQLYHYHKA